MSVLVTDAGGNHALAVVRSLGRRGVRVATAGDARFAKAAWSRYGAERAVYPPATRSVREFLAGLLRIVESLQPSLLMPMTERTILALLSARREIESRVRLAPLPSEESIRVAFDKAETLRLANALGVPTPRTVVPAGPADVAQACEALAGPVVIKPRRSEVETADGRIVPGGSAAYCFRPEDLEARYLAVHRRAPLPLVQEYVPGPGYGISALCVRGAVRVLFAHRRLRTIRPTGSGSSLRESVAPPPAMAAAARALLRALRWHGVAMVEFKLDPRDGRPRLMEINGRFWNSLPLAVAAGIDFPFLLYRLATEGDVPEGPEYRPGIRCRWLVGDAQHLAGVLRGRPAGWPDPFPGRARTIAEFLKFFGRDLHYDDLWLGDPLPFLADLADLALRRLPHELLRRREPAVIEAKGRGVAALAGGARTGGAA